MYVTVAIHQEQSLLLGIAEYIKIVRNDLIPPQLSYIQLV